MLKDSEAKKWTIKALMKVEFNHSIIMDARKTIEKMLAFLQTLSVADDEKLLFSQVKATLFYSSALIEATFFSVGIPAIIEQVQALYDGFKDDLVLARLLLKTLIVFNKGIDETELVFE